MISDTDWEALRKIWIEKNEKNMFLIREYLQKKYRVKNSSVEKMILFGKRSGDQMYEELIGFLYGIVPGVVILDTSHDLVFRPLSGLLMRFHSSEFQFHIKSFAPLSVSGSLGLRLGNDFFRSQFENCLIALDCDLGRDVGIHYGIEESRWSSMSKWFDKWLPILEQPVN